MLAVKPMTFMEMVDALGVSTSHLTYHLESLGELVSKLENNQYKLSTFGEATVIAMRTVEETPEIETKRRRMLTLRWKSVLAALLIGVVLLAAMSTAQYYSINQLSSNQQLLASENEQLKLWGQGAGKSVFVLRDMVQLDLSKYKLVFLENKIEYLSTFNAVQELPKYSLESSESNIEVRLRFRNSHFSRLDMDLVESSPIYHTPQPNNIIDIAKGILARYQNFSGDAYLQEMSDLLATVNKAESTEVTQGNMKLKITLTSGISGEFYWVYMENGVDFTPKSLKIIIENRFLKEMTDGYFIFTVGSTNVDISQEEAVQIAKSQAKTMSVLDGGKQIPGSSIQELVRVEFAPHPRAGSTGLIPYWYVMLANSKGALANPNEQVTLITIGIYADTGQIANVQTGRQLQPASPAG